MAKEHILSAKDVEIQFSLRGRRLTAIRKCSIDLYEGETLAIVGESGSGKSVFTKSFVGMLDANGSITGGSILYDGVDISKYKTEKEWLRIRGKKIAMVMQDPMTSLNPLKKIGTQIQESVELHQGLKGSEAKAEAIEMLKKVGIPDPERRYNQYPHEFSGGMRQRVVIAIALACEPELLIADEPTTALDVTIQAQILDLMQELKRKLGMGIIMITHDLGVVASMCDHIAVMYAGEIVEYGTTDDIFYNPQHEYTRGLLRSIPKFHEKDYSKLIPIEGQPVDLLNPPKGCGFAPRCSNCMKICLEQKPVRNEYKSLGGAAIGENVHYGRCWLEQKAQMLGSAEAVVNPTNTEVKADE